eukprot:2806898-Pleurochrysis_carterae.AAC.2
MHALAGLRPTTSSTRAARRRGRQRADARVRWARRAPGLRRSGRSRAEQPRVERAFGARSIQSTGAPRRLALALSMLFFRYWGYLPLCFSVLFPPRRA